MKNERIAAINQKLDFLFPNRQVYARPLTRNQTILLFVMCGVLFFIVGLFIPANGFIAFDWVHVFVPGKIPPFYPPWDQFVSYLPWPLFISLSLAAIGWIGILVALPLMLGKSSFIIGQ